MNRLERLSSEFDRQTGGKPIDKGSWGYVDYRDMRNLLAVAKAVMRMGEPSTLVKGQMRCALCGAEAILAGHNDDCPWMAVVDAFKSLLEGVDNAK